MASAVPPPLLPTGHSSSDAPELKHNVLVEALVVGGGDLAHRRVEAIVRHVCARRLGRACKRVPKAILAARAPAARRAEDGDDQERRRARFHSGRGDEERLGGRVAKGGDALAEGVGEEEGELREGERLREARDIAARSEGHRVEVAEILVLAADEDRMTDGDLRMSKEGETGREKAQ